MITFYMLGTVSGFALFGMLDDMRVQPKENWVLCFDTPLTREASCGPHNFDSFDSCARARDWVRGEVRKNWSHAPGRTQNHRCNRAIEK